MNGRLFESAYMQWAKIQSRSRFNLATSGVPGFPLAELGVSIEDLEVNGPGGYGYTPLREAISREYNVPVESVVAGAGTSGANAYAFLLLLGAGDQALVESPAYEILPNLARFTGAAVTTFERRPENGWTIDPDEIAHLITPRTKLVVLTNLHNPSSALTEEATLIRIGEIAAQQGAYVLVDEVYLDCVWDRPQRSAFHLGPNFIVTGSLTKIYGLSGLRCGWIFAPAAVAQKLWHLVDLFDNIPAHPAELMSVIAFRKLPAIKEQSKQLMETNRAAYREFARKYNFEVPAYGTVAFPRLPTGSADKFCETLRADYETSVVPGRFFSAPDRVRISLVAPPEMFTEGLRRVDAALTESL